MKSSPEKHPGTSFAKEPLGFFYKAFILNTMGIEEHDGLPAHLHAA